MSIYLFKETKKRVRRPDRLALSKVLTMRDTTNDDPPVQPVQSIMPDSIQEWRMAVALTYLKLTFRYQYSVFGGRRLSRGQLIDFLVYTAPYPTAVYVQGTYWHNRAKDDKDKFNQERVKQYFKGKVRILEAPEEKLTSVQAAISFCKKELI